MEAPYAYAATEGPGQAARERDLCKTASQFDWIYSGSTVLLTAGAIALDNLVVQSAKEPELRLTGPALIGITWGSVLGGGYLSLPKCDAGFVDGAPPDGDVHVRWPIAVAVALLAGATAPLVVGIETGTGPSTDPWSTTERSMRLVVASAAGIGGSLLPYVLPPRTWRAAQELRRIRAGADGRAAFLSYTLSF
jgi:hypothetical protein